MRVYPSFWRAGAALFFPQEFVFEVEFLSAETPFGEKEAMLVVSAPSSSLALLAEALGAEVTIETNGERWRGVVEDVEWSQGGVTYRRSLEDVKTALSVFYDRRTAFGQTEAAQTATAYRNADLYGVREELHTATQALTDAEAEALRDALLARRSEPLTEFELSGEDGAGRLRCVGWLRSRCEQRYYRRGEGVLTLVEERDGAQHWFGWTGTLAGGEWATTGNRRLHTTQNVLMNLPVERWMRLSGHSALAGRHQIVANDTRPTATYTGAVQFIAPDRIVVSDAAFLAACAKDDVVHVSGSLAVNNGFHRVEQVRDGELRIKESYSGVQNHAATAATLRRCAYVEFGATFPGGVNLRTATQSLTLALDGVELYQRFIAPTWRLRWIEFYVQSPVVNAPGAIEVRLTADAGGAPGATLLSATTTPLADGWLRFDLGQLSNLTANAVYGLHLRLPSAAAFSAYTTTFYPRYDAALPWALLWDGASWNVYDAAVAARLIGADDVAEVLRLALESVGATVHAPSATGSHVEIHQPDAVILSDFIEETLQRAPSVRMLTHSGDAAAGPRVVLGAGLDKPGGFKLANGALRWPNGVAVQGWIDLLGAEVTDASGEQRMVVAAAEWRDGKWRLLDRKEAFRTVEQG